MPRQDDRGNFSTWQVPECFLVFPTVFRWGTHAEHMLNLIRSPWTEERPR
jgi:hypothetical protein